MRRDRQQSSDLITAQEVACWAYCPEQWRLQYGLGLRAGNQAELNAGTRHHEQKGRGRAGSWRLDCPRAVPGRSGGCGAPAAALVVAMSLGCGIPGSSSAASVMR